MIESDLMPRHERLLVVEDDAFSQELIALYLRKAGFTDITSATDGRQALDLAKSQSFDLVLLDLNLPRISGAEVLRRLKKEGFLTDTPVIVISSLSNMDDTVRCLDLGAEDYLPKPFNVRLLEGRVGACLEQRRLKAEARAALQRQARDAQAARALADALAAPTLPAPGLDFPIEAALLRDPAPTLGGDVADVIALPGGGLCFALGTVAGDGLAAVLAAARVRVRLRAAVDRAGPATPNPQTLLALLNEDARAAGSGTASLIVGVIDPRSGTLCLANAGAADPAVVGGGRGVRRVATERGRGLGEQPDARHPVRFAELIPGETLVLWTDGLTRAADAAGTHYGEHRLVERLADCPADMALAAAETLIADVRHFAGSRPPEQDRTALALRLLPNA